MIPIKNSIICLIFFLNILGYTLIFLSIRLSPSSSFFLSKFNSIGSKAKNNRINLSYNNKDNLELFKINENNNILNGSRKLLRELTKYEREGAIVVIILIVFSILVNIYLILSLNHENNKENETNYTEQRNNSNNRQEGIGVIKCIGDCTSLCRPIGAVVFLILLPFVIIDLSIEMHKCMGQKNSAYCSLILLSIIQFGMSIFCFYIMLHITGIIALGLFLVNFLTILIPNLDCIKRKKNNDNENLDNNSKFGTPETMVLQENEFNNILINDKNIITPMLKEENNSKMNNNGKLIEDINGIDTFEKNNEKDEQCFIDKNVKSSISINDQVIQEPNSRIDVLISEPLPSDDGLPTEK